MHGVEVKAAAREQIFQEESLLRCVRVQGEINPLHVDVEILFQLFNTPGTEIAPGSDKIGKDLQCDRFVHSQRQ